jgi:hypothetical protein
MAMHAFARASHIWRLRLRTRSIARSERWELLARWQAPTNSRGTQFTDITDLMKWCVRARFADEWKVVAERPPLCRGAGVAERALIRGLHVAGEAVIRGSITGWTEAGLISSAGGDVTVFGPGGGDHHMQGEWVELSEVSRAAAVLTEAARRADQ